MRRSREWAYLRVRGGTSASICVILSDLGLSPRTRRNLFPCFLVPVRVGPISAYAEEPTGLSLGAAGDAAYLRVRGGTKLDAIEGRMAEGLSPPTRRNRAVHRRAAALYGPISAYAEEPASSFSTRMTSRAYLRVRGGTTCRRIVQSLPRGLSPRTRRNRFHHVVGHLIRGPISAYAEEPVVGAALYVLTAAYLRVRRGTPPA